MVYKTQDYLADPDILAGVHGLRSPIHRTINLDYVSADSDGRKFLPAGTFYSDLGGGYARPLPRTKVTADVGTGTPTLPVTTPQNFIVGDVLLALIPFGKVTIASSSGGWAAADTITVTLNSLTYVYTVLAEDIGGSLSATNTNIAAKVVALLNAQASKYVTATANAGVVQLLSATGQAYSLAASDTGTNGTATASGSALVGGGSVGTVLSVNVDAKTITLAANNATALFSGQAIGAIGSPLGMMVQSLLLDAGAPFVGDMPEQGLYTSASVRLELLPYYDGEIKALLPEIQVV